jgi:hypothetical protein
MTARTGQFAIALALIIPVAIATPLPSLASSGCIQNGGASCFKKGTRPHTVRRAPQPHDDDYQATLDEVLGK